MVLEKAIDLLMRTAIEHAGAERGLMLLSRGVEHRIVAEATTLVVTLSLSNCETWLRTSRRCRNPSFSM